MPDFEPTQIPGVLKSALTIETLSGFNGHNLQRISGWNYGFYNLEWLDANHVMLYPFAGVTGFLDTTIAGTYPAVVNLDLKKFWIPNLSQAAVRNHASFSWSAQLGVLILPGSNNEVFIYSPDGELRNTYGGSLLGVSPSGTKIFQHGSRAGRVTHSFRSTNHLKSTTGKVYVVIFEIQVKGQGVVLHSGQYEWTFYISWDASRDEWVITNYGEG